MPDSRTKLLRMLAEIDQQIREAESLASDATLSDDDRELAAVQLDFRRRALESVETLLSKSEEEQKGQNDFSKMKIVLTLLFLPLFVLFPRFGRWLGIVIHESAALARLVRYERYYSN
jgi:hypothetical protein